jgi:hypothetical protein
MGREILVPRLLGAVEAVRPTLERGPATPRGSFTTFSVSFNRTVAEGPEGSFTQAYDGFMYDYKGFYSLLENVDKGFLQTRYQRGNAGLKGFFLVQADHGRGFFTRAQYTRTGWSWDFADGDKVESEADFRKGEDKLFQLFDTLKPDSTDDQIAALVDIESLANYVVAAELVGHWDSLLANRNNDYLYFDPRTGKWQLLANDLDNSMGANGNLLSSLVAPDLFKPGKSKGSLLLETVFADPRRTAFRQILKDRMRAMITGAGAYTSAPLKQQIDAVRKSVLTDRPRVLDADRIRDFENVGGASFDALESFGKSRRDRYLQQL